MKDTTIHPRQQTADDALVALELTRKLRAGADIDPTTISDPDIRAALSALVQAIGSRKRRSA